MDEYIDVKIDVFEHAGQRARLRKSLTILNLIEEVLREFDDIVADSPEKYALYLKGFDRPLAPNQTLTQLDIQPQDELVFDYFRQTVRQMLEPKDYATVHEETTGKEFDIQWQPAVIGRPSNDMDHNITLAVNVQLLPNGSTVSRSHAQITFSEGRYSIEPLTEYNPVYLNGREINVNKKHELKDGDKIMLGNRQLTLVFRTQKDRRKSPSSASIPRQGERAEKAVVSPQHTLVEELTAPKEIMTPTLVIETATNSSILGQTIEVDGSPFLLGRLHPNLTEENEVSRKHAEITFNPQNQKYFITDLNSTNGVLVEGRSIQPNVPVEIPSGCHIGLGNTLVLRFEK